MLLKSRISATHRWILPPPKLGHYPDLYPILIDS
jgi:hypothetical protein